MYFGEAGKLYKNNGDGTFTDTSNVLPSAPFGGAAWIDYDKDGYDDLFLAPISGDLILHHNKGDGTFEDVSASAGINLVSKNSRLAVGDYNGDKLLMPMKR